MGTGPILGAASIEGAVNWVGPTVVVRPSATIELDGNSAEGALAATSPARGRPFRARSPSSKLDLSPYLEAVRADLVADRLVADRADPPAVRRRDRRRPPRVGGPGR